MDLTLIPGWCRRLEENAVCLNPKLLLRQGVESDDIDNNCVDQPHEIYANSTYNL